MCDLAEQLLHHENAPVHSAVAVCEFRSTNETSFHTLPTHKIQCNVTSLPYQNSQKHQQEWDLTS